MQSTENPPPYDVAPIYRVTNRNIPEVATTLEHYQEGRDKKFW